jgi:hypothetical protein
MFIHLHIHYVGYFQSLQQCVMKSELESVFMEQPVAECNFETVLLFEATEKCHRKPRSVEKVAGPQMRTPDFLNMDT